MKDGYIQDGLLKAEYNIQVGTENQFALAFGIFRIPRHSSIFINSLTRLPKTIIADDGYGSEGNLDYLDQIGVEHLIKYKMFDKEQKGSYKISYENKRNWEYMTEENYFIHRDGKKYYFSHISHKKNTSSFIQVINHSIWKKRHKDHFTIIDTMRK